MYLKILLFGFLSFISIQSQANEPLARPKLVVGLVVDQMRWDYLYRYYNRYGNEGFKRLLREGFSCENTQLNYLPAYTAVGHTSIYTGSVPSLTGIAANDFYIEREKKKVYCTADTSVKSVGSNSKAGEMSPRNLWSSTITDELRLATNFRSKVIGIALKDRASILPGGHSANAAYWYDDAAGKWISSTYYMDKLPTWVNQFNKKDLAADLLKQDWHTLYPIETYVQSTPDDNRFEKPLMTENAPVFPVKTSDIFKKGGHGIIRTTPYGNTFTLAMAKAIVENEKMGKGSETDFLAVSLSSTDYIGHQFGANAIETEDTYLRLDKDLGDFLNFLDNELGKDNYLFFLIADHAAAHNMNFMKAHQLPAGGWDYTEKLQQLDNALSKHFQINGLVYSLDNYQVHFDYQKIADSKLNAEEVKLFTTDWLNSMKEIAYVVDMEKAATAPIPALIREKVINGYCRERNGSLQIIMKPGFYEKEEESTAGTTHGTWHPYDAHIPLIFMGWNIPQGRSHQAINITDLAPTLAALLHIQMPNGCIGQPIPGIVK